MPAARALQLGLMGDLALGGGWVRITLDTSVSGMLPAGVGDCCANALLPSSRQHGEPGHTNGSHQVPPDVEPPARIERVGHVELRATGFGVWR